MPPAFIRTRALEPPASIKDRHLFETRRLLEHWPQAPGIYYIYDTGYTVCGCLFFCHHRLNIDSRLKLAHSVVHRRF